MNAIISMDALTVVIIYQEHTDAYVRVDTHYKLMKDSVKVHIIRT